AAEAKRAIDGGLPSHNGFEVLQALLRIQPAALVFALYDLGFLGFKPERPLTADARFAVVAADQIVATVDFLPAHGPAVIVASPGSFAVGGVALLRIDRFAPLITVKLLKNNVFHSIARFHF